jgi:hypothetical protein
MNISSQASLSQLNASSPEGNSARADYQVAVAQKINQQTKQEGEAVVKLIESAPKPSRDGVTGINLNEFA